jgi:hypothetical protein
VLCVSNLHVCHASHAEYAHVQHRPRVESGLLDAGGVDVM